MKSPSYQGKSKREIYQEQYDASKQGGEMFFPDTIVRDAIMALIVVAVIIALAILYPAISEPPADPTTTTYNPRPEWYFLLFFQFLKLFPGSLEPVAAVIMPLIGLAILALVPFLDTGMERRWEKRKVMMGIGSLALAGLVALEIGGTISAPARPAGEASQQVQLGRSVYNQVACSYCHSINGIGGTVGPDLTDIGGTLTSAQLADYLQNPHAMIPKSLHPKLEFTQQELQALVAYLETLGAKVSFTAEAPVLFQKNCSPCHMINGQGGTVGPDLSGIGSRRPISFIEAFTSDPGSVIPGASMPPFRSVLSQSQIKDIAAYLFSLKSQTPTSPSTTPTPTPSLPPTPTPTPAPTPTSVDGASLFTTYCSGCHSRASLASLSASTITSRINSGTGSMPAFGSILTSAQITAIVQYVRGTTPAPAPAPAPTPATTPTPAPVEGASLFTTYCSGCHNRTSLASLSASIITSRINTGTGSMPAFGGVLSPAQITAIVQYVRGTTTAPAPTPGPTTGPAPTTLDGALLFTTYCSRCHNRASLARLSASRITSRINNGEDSMPAFGGTLSPDQISAIVQYIKGTALAPTTRLAMARHPQ